MTEVSLIVGGTVATVVAGVVLARRWANRPRVCGLSSLNFAGGTWVKTVHDGREAAVRVR